MWVLYEHPELTTLNQVLTASPFPVLRDKAKLCCIPSTAGSASEVSRSVVITENGQKHGLGNMEMMPDIAICDPQVTLSMPKSITAETGMDAMTHAVEALVSQRAHYLSDLFCEKAIADIARALPAAYENPDDIDARETMLNASMIAGMAFTNVSLGIVHSIAHALGSVFHLAHGLADAVLLPYVIAFNSERSGPAKEKYAAMAEKLGANDLAGLMRELNAKMQIPASLSNLILDKAAFEKELPRLAEMALADGCTKTNPAIPTAGEMRELIEKAYNGGQQWS